ncbi:MAG: invasion associated locus B family protein [Alphaproteobacteria bacterium]
MVFSLVRLLSIAAAAAVATSLAFAPAQAAKAKSAPKSAPSKAAAGSNKPLGAFKDWNAYMLDDPAKKVCFVVSEPKSKKLSKGANRGDPFFMITRWSQGAALQPSMIVGYPQPAGGKAKVTIGKDKFDMFVDADGAWMDSEDGDRKLLDAMRKGSTMIVESASAKGTKSTDRYSLAGLSAALDKLGSTCP